MSVPTNTLESFSVPTNREDLEDIIYMTADTNTPLTMLATASQREKVTNRKHEWSIDSLPAAAANKQLEGDDVSTFDVPNIPDRVGNYVQISTHQIAVSTTQQAVLTAGIPDTVAYEAQIFTEALVRDVEFAMSSNNPSIAGSAGVAPQSGGLRAWLTTNTDLGVGGADGGYNTGTGIVDAATNGTTRAFTETLLLNVEESMRDQGVTPDCMVMAPKYKRALANFTGGVTRFQDAEDQRITRGIDVYTGNFAEMEVYTSTFTTGREVFMLDRDFISLGELVPLRLTPLAKTGLNDKFQLEYQWTLIVRNEAAIGAVCDLA
jgi:hypothetical protein